MDNEVPKQLNLSSNGITNESGTGEQYLLFGFSCSLVSRRTPSTWFLFLEYSRYPHPGGLWTPLSQSLIHSYFLGPQTSLRFYLLSCTYAMLYCFIYDCARSTLYCLGIVTHFRGIDKPSHTFGFRILWLLCREGLVGFWFGFSEVDRVCVAICAPLQGKTFWKPCPRLWTTWSTVSRS